MNAKQITLKNITDNGYIIGKSVKGKGLEIFSDEKTVFYKYLGTCSNKEIEDKLSKHDKSKLFIESYRVSSDTSWVCNQKIPLDDFVLDLASLECFSIKKESSLLGYIPISKYKSDKDSQVELCRDLLRLEQIETRDEVFDSYYDIEYDDSIKTFKSDSSGYYWNGDYILKHGNNICEIKSDCAYFDGRMDNYNELVMDDYEFDEGGYLKYIDPEETICVYNRKYKDWYIGYSLNQKYMNISYKEIGYDYDKDDCEEEELFFITYKENKELLDKVKDFLKTEKEDLEMRSFINNELDDDYDYRNTSFSIPSLEFVFEDLTDLKDQIRDNIDWDYSNIKSNFQKTLSALLDKAILIDEKFIATINGSKYKQLRKLYKLGKVMDFELVKTAVSSEDSNISWAIKRGDEEYHFSPLSLIYSAEEEDEDIREFAENAITCLEKRRIEKLSEKELYEKASRVFVSVEDSLKSGNCKFGTDNFISRHGIDLNKIGGIRGDYLLNIEKSNFTTRAVQYAIQKVA
ncbi:MAG: hypothetical protein RBR65_02355 [Aliarcobacter sp.]|jgi:hypothetical protein|nr:hypothetical protein [Aliarcobacter sp.]